MIAKDQAASLRKMMDKKKSRAHRNSRIITVASGKGGAGKSNVTVNIGRVLSGMGQRVLIIDADLGMANIDILLDLETPNDFGDFVKDKCSLQETIVETESGLEVLPGMSVVKGWVDVNYQQIKKLIQASKEIEDNYDIILVDIGAGAGEVVVNFALAGDEMLLVLTPEPTSVMDAYSLLKILSNHSFSSEVKMIVNQVTSNKEAEDISDRMTGVIEDYLDLNCSFLDCIPYDDYLKESVRKQKPVVDLFPESKAGLALKRTAGKLIGKEVQEKPSRGMKGFAYRILGIFRNN